MASKTTAKSPAKATKPVATKVISKSKPELTQQIVDQVQKDFASNPINGVLQNAITQVSVVSMVNRREAVINADHTFSIQLDDWAVTNQKGSGRCWMFAGTNLLRAGAMKKLNLKGFEFSQNYVMFWDKFEKANYFLEAMIATADRPVSDRTVQFIMGHPMDDGGQWNMFVNIVKKYGLVPKVVMPETESSSNTGMMNGMLITKLRQGAKTLRDLAAKGASIDDLRATKANILTVAYRMLALHLGNPPSTFDWQWIDNDKKLHRETEMTPQKFAKKYVSVPIDEYVCLVHDPRPSSPVGKTFTVDFLGNVAGGGKVIYLNIEIDLMKKIAMKALQDNEPVWFGCDCGKSFDRTVGIWDIDLQDYDSIYNTSFDMDKVARLEYCHTAMNHAMLFTGVDIVDGKPRRWRVENSWGDTGGQKGFYQMNDTWFTEHVFEIAARKKSLPEKLQKALDEEPIVLPAWDPMGALA